ncbi:hypothetical protein [Virgibacillus litoralis]|uniref:Tetratricopeptide repeat protein n=1 Tax=Virgibacillus litoralis TaxID=578221 RepID=A0ABS4HBF8_9BACI|nr:hypothetical protein [Virgibacillus litoralis]MBP1948198.1 hypothetical protein [Virgibacillus litoralis]
MDRDQFLIYDQQKQIRVQPERISLYMQSEIIEAISENNEMYYLFFYKNNFLTAAKAKRLRRQSFIERAFTRGIVYNAPHPFINMLLTSNHPCKIIGFKPLLKKLETNYTPQEKAFILTFFESFIPKKHLFEEIKSIFYVYRRNGQGFLGYRIIRILMDFAPKHSFVTQVSNDLILQKYEDQYNSQSDDLLVKDLIFAEKTLYSQKDDNQRFQQLIDHLEKESRWTDMIALYCYKLSISPETDYYNSLANLLEQHLNKNESESILERLDSQLPAFLPLQQDLFNKYVKTHQIEKVFHMMQDREFKLSNDQIQTFGELLEHLDSRTYSSHPEMLNTILESVINASPEKAEKLLNKYVVSLLENHEVAYIQELLKPFKENHGSLEIIRKIDTMERLSDDLDQMQTLGELYYEFNLLDKAIECFSWEMELKPTQPKPLQWLSKVYRDKGLNHESDAYQQLCINLQKNA